MVCSLAISILRAGLRSGGPQDEEHGSGTEGQTGINDFIRRSPAFVCYRRLENEVMLGCYCVFNEEHGGE